MKTKFEEKTLKSIEEALNEYRYLCSQYEDVRMEQFVISSLNVTYYSIRYRYERN